MMRLVLNTSNHCELYDEEKRTSSFNAQANTNRDLFTESYAAEQNLYKVHIQSLVYVSNRVSFM